MSLLSADATSTLVTGALESLRSGTAAARGSEEEATRVGGAGRVAASPLMLTAVEVAVTSSGSRTSFLSVTSSAVTNGKEVNRRSGGTDIGMRSVAGVEAGNEVEAPLPVFGSTIPCTYVCVCGGGVITPQLEASIPTSSPTTYCEHVQCEGLLVGHRLG